MNKDHIIKMSDKQLNDINENLEKINKMNVFDEKITLNQKGSGIFSFLLPMLASTIIPTLIPKKEGFSISNKIIFFEQVKNKCMQYLKTTGHFEQRATIVFACKYSTTQLYCNHYVQAGTFYVII